MKRTTLILVAALVLLGALTTYVLQRPGEQSSSGSTGDLLATYDSAAIDRLEITGASGTVVLRKDGGRWKLASPIAYAADNAAVTGAVGKGKSIELKSVVSTNPAKQALFQVDSAATLVRAFAGDAERAAFRVGKAGPSWSETYVRREGSNEVYLADGLLTYTFAKTPKDWRDRTIFSAEQSAVTRVAFRYGGDTAFTLALTDSVWRVDGDSAVESSARSLVSSLATLQTDEFIDTAVTALPPLAATISLNETDLRFFPVAESGKYIVQSSRSAQLFELQNWRAQQVLKRKADLLPPKK